jgi:hypothetical protein
MLEEILAFVGMKMSQFGLPVFHDGHAYRRSRATGVDRFFISAPNLSTRRVTVLTVLTVLTDASRADVSSNQSISSYSAMD